MSDNANRFSDQPAMADRPGLEAVLQRQLRPVQAPADLWRGLHASPRPKPSPYNRLAWAAAAAIFIIGGALGGHTYLQSQYLQSQYLQSQYLQSNVRRDVTIQAASSASIRSASTQSGTKFALQLACQACHLSSAL